MEYGSFHMEKAFLIFLVLGCLCSNCIVQAQVVGSCEFEGNQVTWMCGYQQASDDVFNWTRLSDSQGGHYLAVQSEHHLHKQNAKVVSPVIELQDTHCVSFRYYTEGLTSTAGNTTAQHQQHQQATQHQQAAVRLNVYVLDHDSSVLHQAVWLSPLTGGSGGWQTVELALNPRSYQLVFEAVVIEQTPGLVALDGIRVSKSACDSTVHFLRLGNKEVNVGSNETLQCLLFGHNGEDTRVYIQKSNGAVLNDCTRRLLDDHLSASFQFNNVQLKDHGMYRCVSGNETQVGVSNYAILDVKVPPVPMHGPVVEQAGSTHLTVRLNSDDFSGDSPVVQKILNYRPEDGGWSDVHHISEPVYELWHLKPDTDYILTVTLVRPGPGGAGVPGPELRVKTKCGDPVHSVMGVELDPVGSDKLRVTWAAADFSVTNCHYFTYRVNYRQHHVTDESTNHSTTSAPWKSAVAAGNAKTLGGLQPYTKYEIRIALGNSVGSKETGLFVGRTAEGVPGPISQTSFIVTSSNETTVALQWERPEIANGVLTSYQIAYQAVKSHDPSFAVERENAHIERAYEVGALTLHSLRPGTTFNISICAETRVGCGPRSTLVATTDIAAPTMPQYPDPSTWGNSTNDTTVEIILIPAHSNGAPVTNYYVIIEDVTDAVDDVIVDDEKKAGLQEDEDEELKGPRLRAGKNRGVGRRRGRQRNKSKARGRRDVMRVTRDVMRVTRDVTAADDACQRPPTTYEEAKRAGSNSYAGAKFSPDQLTTETKFVVGGGESPAAGGFSNPPLDPTRKYRIYVRAESSVGGDTRVSCVLVARKDAREPIPTSLPDSPTPTEQESGGQRGSAATDGKPGVQGANVHTGQTTLYAAVAAAVAACIIIIIVVVACRFKKSKKTTRKDEVVNPFEVRLMLTDMTNNPNNLLPSPPAGSNGGVGTDRQHLMPDVVGYEHQDFVDKASESGVGGAGGGADDERFAVRVDDFHLHVSQMKATGGYGFREEFALFQDGPTASWSVAESSLNRPKNRYLNVMAYDHSRVVLDPPPGDEEAFTSDYINASYINGYKNPTMYIATQAPTQDTAQDFWLMTWQERCSVVVMLTNTVELGKRKCFKYWPDDRETYGTLQVSCTGEDLSADYCVRTFLLQQTGGYDVREVKQFHFTAWPDHGVPSRPTNLLTFVRRVKAYEPPEGPTIVHCSAGSGRTGCYITIDEMLDMAREEEIVDIYNTVCELRTRRVDMVQTEEQYVFIHEALLEALICGETSVSADRLAHHYDDLITVDQFTHLAPVQEEFDTLNVITPKLSEEECSVARLPRNRPLNRFKDVLPADRHLAYLVTPDPHDRDSNYVNAVYVDSYTARNTFVVTQMPLPSTVVDIWRLVYDHNTTSIVMMNDQSEHDQTCSVYWPESGIAKFGPFTVELVKKEDEVDVITRLFRLVNHNNPGDKGRLVQQFQLTNWPSPQPVPYSRNAVLRVVQLVMKWQAECNRLGESSRAVVHCVAGAGRSGTFVACYNMCEQMRREYAVDVFNIVQRLRNIRPHLVETLEQYRFCYEVGIEFADQ